MFETLLGAISGAAMAHAHHTNPDHGADDRRHFAECARGGAAWVRSGEPYSEQAAGYAGHTARHVGDRPAGCGW